MATNIRMNRLIKFSIQKILAQYGYKISEIVSIEPDQDKRFKTLFTKYSPYTLSSVERVFSLYQAVQYIVEAKIPGDFVECGVWQGGNCMIMADMLLSLGETKRKIYLYDTFTGMSKPSKYDVNYTDKSYSLRTWKKGIRKDHNEMSYAPIEEVRTNILKIGYPKKNIVFVMGKVEDTIPNVMPQNIALLRLDTDWYESTKHEMNYLFPKLNKHGVLIIDDYGHWAGAKKAVDEYIKKNKVSILLNRVDYTCRIGLKI